METLIIVIHTIGIATSSFGIGQNIFEKDTERILVWASSLAWCISSLIWATHG